MNELLAKLCGWQGGHRRQAVRPGRSTRGDARGSQEIRPASLTRRTARAAAHFHISGYLSYYIVHWHKTGRTFASLRAFFLPLLARFGGWPSDAHPPTTALRYAPDALPGGLTPAPSKGLAALGPPSKHASPGRLPDAAAARDQLDTP